MRNTGAERQAAEHAAFIRHALDMQTEHPIGVVLGTGWGDKLQLRDARELPLGTQPGFSGLQELQGHARKYVVGRLGDTEVMALSGRIHLNEMPHSMMLAQMVRLQIEIMLQAGVEKMILTCAAGSLPGSYIRTGSLVAIDGFVSLFAPDMPLSAGEFCNPEDTLDDRMRLRAIDMRDHYLGGDVRSGGHAMVRGPQFEGRRYDKKILASTGASIVGMSVYPEACICALYPGTRVLGLAFVTNDADEAHSHETNLARANEAGAHLSEFLKNLIVTV